MDIGLLQGHQPLQVHLKTIDVRVFVKALAKVSRSISRKLVFIERTAFPGLLSNDPF
jgi:hypothetical protein